MKNVASLSVTAIRTSVFSHSEELLRFLTIHLKGKVQEGDVVAITSKIISVAENCLVPADELSKREIVQKEADVYLGEGGYGVELTIKHGLLIPSAGIDESNSASGEYILFPKDPYESARKIGEVLRQELSIKDLGIILTDSHTLPLRMGVTGISLAHWGFKATRSLVGDPDLFGRPLKFTHVDVVDALATMAVFAMGESDDCCPLAIVRGANIEFTNMTSKDEIAIELEKDIYYPLLKRSLGEKKS